MKVKVARLAFGAVAVGLGYALWTQSSGGSVVTSGTITLEPRVPYELTLDADAALLDSPMTRELEDRQTEVKAELIKLSAYDVTFTRTRAGVSQVSFRMTPAFAIPLTIGAQLDRAGTWGPRLILSRVERLDGKAIH